MSNQNKYQNKKMKTKKGNLLIDNGELKEIKRNTSNENIWKILMRNAKNNSTTIVFISNKSLFMDHETVKEFKIDTSMGYSKYQEKGDPEFFIEKHNYFHYIFFDTRNKSIEEKDTIIVKTYKFIYELIAMNKKMHFIVYQDFEVDLTLKLEEDMNLKKMEDLRNNVIICKKQKKYLFPNNIEITNKIELEENVDVFEFIKELTVLCVFNENWNSIKLIHMKKNYTSEGLLKYLEQTQLKEKLSLFIEKFKRNEEKLKIIKLKFSVNGSSEKKGRFRIKFTVKNVDYRLSIDHEKHLLIFTKNDEEILSVDFDIKEDLYHIDINNGFIRLKCGDYEKIIEDDSIDLLYIKDEIFLKNYHKDCYFENFNIISIKEPLSNCENIKKNYTKLFNYKLSIAFFFISNIYNKTTFDEYHENVYKLIQIHKELGYKIYILTGSSCSYLNILKIFDEITQLHKKQNFDEFNISRFTFYYLGHTKINLIDEEKSQYLAAFSEEGDENIFSAGQLLHNIKKLPFKHKLIIIESCLSGNIIKIPTINFESKNEKNHEKKTIIIAASINEIYAKGDLAGILSDSYYTSKTEQDKSMNNICIEMHNMTKKKNEEYEKSERINEKFLIDPVFSLEGDGNIFFVEDEFVDIHKISINFTDYDPEKITYNVFKNKNFDIYYD